MTVRKIISGGQTGADRGGLDAAIALGIEHGGWCPYNRRADDGRIPAKYNMTQTPSRNYTDRTRCNVRDADATLIVVRPPILTPGSRLTRHHALQLARPNLVVMLPRNPPAQEKADLALRVGHWLHERGFAVLNVAGSRESKAPGLQLDTASLVELAIRGMI